MVYDAYYVADFCNLTMEQEEDLREWSFNCLTTVAALGFGDIPPKAFVKAFNINGTGSFSTYDVE